MQKREHYKCEYLPIQRYARDMIGLLMFRQNRLEESVHSWIKIDYCKDTQSNKPNMAEQKGFLSADNFWKWVSGFPIVDIQ